MSLLELTTDLARQTLQRVDVEIRVSARQCDVYGFEISPSAGFTRVWGKDRPTAIRRAIRALNELVVDGVATTIPADMAILEADEFQNVTHSTSWVQNGLDLTGVRSIDRKSVV